MLPLGPTRYVDFTLADVNSTPIAGRTLADWSQSPNHLIFLRNKVACTDVLSLHDYGDGRYTLSYAPSAAGHDYLEIWDAAEGLKVLDIEDIVSQTDLVGSSVVTVLLDHNYGGTDALRVDVPDPDNYTVQVFYSADWTEQRRNDADALGSAALDANGRWLKVIPVTSGIYTVVAKCFREVRILRYDLEV